LLVYRDSVRRVSGEAAVHALAASLDRGSALEALLTAGELECGFADLDEELGRPAAAITDALAGAFVFGDGEAFARARSLAAALPRPAVVELRRPEGYAFYALDPAAFAALASTLPLSLGGRVFVVGVRSIGTSLSAVVRAALAQRGLAPERFTVRPTGHPWDRTLELSGRLREAAEQSARNSEFLVVDEGPGMSGSTFLAVGEALERHGVSVERVRFLGSHPVDAERLVARDGARRWARFRMIALPARGVNAGLEDFSGGRWRARVFADPRAWPPTWAEQERTKHFVPERGELLKFSGYPPYQNPVLARARALFEAGFGPRVHPDSPGFLAHAWIPGRPACAVRDRALLLDALPRYLAFRREAFPSREASPGALETMTRVNSTEELGVDWPVPSLPIVTPVEPDGRMQAHEWIVSGSGLSKTDGADHADDHLYPGPTDMAWDLAGAVVEWELDEPSTRRLLRRYRRLTGDDASGRLTAYTAAYCAFRLGFARFAERSADEQERARWARASVLYRSRLVAALEALGARSDPFVVSGAHHRSG